MTSDTLKDKRVAWDDVNGDYREGDIAEAVKKLKEVKERFDLKRILIITQFSRGDINWRNLIDELIDLDDKLQDEIDKIMGIWTWLNGSADS